VAGGAFVTNQKVKRTPEQISRRKARNRIVVFGFFMFLGIVIILESPLTRVRSVVVSGNRTILETKLIQDANLHSGQSLWQINQGAVAQKIMAKEPLVQSVSLHTDMMRGIVSLQITEKHIIAIYEAAGKFYNLLNDGTAYQEIGATNGFSFPLVTTANGQVPTVGQIVNKDVGQVCTQLGELSQENLSTLSEIHVVAAGNVEIYLDNGFVATCPGQQLAAALPSIHDAVGYFSSRGYRPGMIDLTGPPPYRYTPFAPSKQSGDQSPKKGG
jgi:cell division protein FtsQ